MSIWVKLYRTYTPEFSDMGQSGAYIARMEAKKNTKVIIKEFKNEKELQEHLQEFEYSDVQLLK